MADPSPPIFAGGQHVALRASMTLRVVLAAFILLCAVAVGTSVVSFVGVASAMLAGLTIVAYLASVARRSCASRVPAALRIEADMLTLGVFDRVGRRVVHGSVVGCAQWADWLLVLVIRGEHGRSVRLIVPSDALDACTFRALSALGRRATRS